MSTSSTLSTTSDSEQVKVPVANDCCFSCSNCHNTQVCIYCLKSVNVNSRTTIRPCECQFVHRECLSNWIRKTDNPENKYTCSVCKADYLFHEISNRNCKPKKTCCQKYSNIYSTLIFIFLIFYRATPILSAVYVITGRFYGCIGGTDCPDNMPSGLPEFTWVVEMLSLVMICFHLLVQFAFLESIIRDKNKFKQIIEKWRTIQSSYNCGKEEFYWIHYDYAKFSVSIVIINIAVFAVGALMHVVGVLLINAIWPEYPVYKIANGIRYDFYTWLASLVLIIVVVIVALIFAALYFCMPLCIETYCSDCVDEDDDEDDNDAEKHFEIVPFDKDGKPFPKDRRHKTKTPKKRPEDLV